MDEQAKLAALLDITITLGVTDLAAEHRWRSQVRGIVGDHPPASLDQQSTDLKADMRELLRHALTDPTIVATIWFVHRARRALCQHEGIVGPGESCLRQYRWATKRGWSDWLPLPEDDMFEPPPTRMQIRWGAAGEPFRDWAPTQRTLHPSDHTRRKKYEIRHETATTAGSQGDPSAQTPDANLKSME